MKQNIKLKKKKSNTKKLMRLSQIRGDTKHYKLKYCFKSSHYQLCNSLINIRYYNADSHKGLTKHFHLNKTPSRLQLEHL